MASTTVFSRDTETQTKEILSSLDSTSLIDIFNRSNLPQENLPRDRNDYLKSIILGNPLSLYNYSEMNELGAFLNDFNKAVIDSKVRYVLAFDTETTGYTGYACSAAFILHDLQEMKKVKEFYQLINPQMNIPSDATAVHGITNADVENEKTFDHFIPEIEEMFMQADISVGHNVIFDFKVLEREYERAKKPSIFINYPYFDTMKLAKNLMKFRDKNGKLLKDPKLEEAMEFYGLKQEGSYHNALTDTDSTLQVFLKMIGF